MRQGDTYSSYLINFLYHFSAVSLHNDTIFNMDMNFNQRASTISRKDTKSKSMIYFSQLSKRQMLELSEMYALDLRLFDYDMQKYSEINEKL